MANALLPPAIYGLKIVVDSGVLKNAVFIEKIEFYHTEEDFLNNKAQLSPEQLDQDVFLKAITQIHSLQNITLYFNTVHRKVEGKFTEQLLNICGNTLKYLHIESYYNPFQTTLFVPFSLKNTPHLEFLKIKYTDGNVNLEVPLPYLKHLKLHALYQINFDKLAHYLNPQILETIELRQIGSLQITEKAILPFKSLKKLNLSGNKYKVLPFLLTHLPALEVLDISSNTLNKPPMEIVNLKNLQKLELRSTSFTKKTTLDKSKDWLLVIQALNHTNLTEQEKQELFQLCWGKETLSATQALHYLGIIDNANLQGLLLIVLEKTHISILESGHFEPKGSEIALIGYWQGLNKAEIQKIAKNASLKISNKITPKTQLVCLGDKFKASEIQTLQHYPHLPFCLASQFKRYIQNFDNNAYLNQNNIDSLTEAEEILDAEKRLIDLLLSNDKENHLLALQMLKSAGMPPKVLIIIFIRLIMKWLQMKNILPLLKKYATSEQLFTLQQCTKLQPSKAMKTLFKSKAFDPVLLTQVILDHFEPNETSYEICLREIIAYKGAPLQLFLNKYTSDEGKTLTIEDKKLQTFALKNKSVQKMLSSFEKFIIITTRYYGSAYKDNFEKFIKEIFPHINIIFRQ
ncbi:MAG: leucine-rich repeat domain-containing protein [Cytophagales bacterium]|nr:MAG: leucine-rich repeat domain-containing protein [Cytophagales bacterium]